ncbi:hypothetical protein CO229_00450 [Mycoplasmopsis bovirhinis]|nr:hypothetical protein CO229_00450 [Mycoplasmopsis bovirhinis]
MDFLKKDPKDYLSEKQQSEFAEYKEYADLAVFETDFSNVNDKSALEIYTPKSNLNSFLNTEDFLKRLTNYATKTEDKQTTFLKDSYLKNYETIDTPLANNNDNKPLNEYFTTFNINLEVPSLKDRVKIVYRAVDFLKADPKDYLSQEQKAPFSEFKEYADFVVIEIDFSNLYSKVGLEIKNPKNNNSFENPAVTTFKDKPRVYDAFLAWPLVDTDTNPLKTVYNDKTTSLIQMGLRYALANYKAPGGASGSSVRNDKNELVSIFYSVGPDTLLGMSSDFRSEGYNYQGLYGKYNLPQYDLIYGWCKDQAEGNSYREALVKINPNMKTHVFKEGVNKEYLQFKFNN